MYESEPDLKPKKNAEKEDEKKTNKKRRQKQIPLIKNRARKKIFFIILPNSKILNIDTY